jgi:peptidoglycan/xylan/chitin deacetylase (PgdA/CDA1 family)
MPRFRLDRAVSVSLIRPFSQWLNWSRSLRVPILMYHGIRERLGGGHPYFEVATSPSVFANHLEFLRDNGYKPIDLNEALEVIMVRRDGNGNRPIVITFDDGYRDFYTHAFPLLMEHGFNATVFVVSGLVRNQSMCRENETYMSWQQLREVHRHGIRVGSHTVSHPELQRMSPREIEYEVRQSKETIEDRLGQSIRSFSFPYAFPEHDRRFRSMLRTFLEIHGYEHGVTTILGTSSQRSDWFFLPRLPVNSFDDIRLFQAKLEGAYDWLHGPQYAYKVAKGVGLRWRGVDSKKAQMSESGIV